MIFLMRFIVKGASMEPTFREEQVVLVSAIPYVLRQPKVGEVVIVRDPRDGRLLLKRIITIRPRTIRPRRSTALGPTRSTHEYFVAGDNPKASTDSRNFGSVKEHDILGKLVWRLI